MHNIYLDTSILAYYFSNPHKAGAKSRKSTTKAVVEKLLSFEDSLCCTSELTLLELHKYGVRSNIIEKIAAEYQIIKPTNTTEKIFQEFGLISEHHDNYRFSNFHVALALSNKCSIILSWMMPDYIKYEQFELTHELSKNAEAGCPIICNPEQLLDYMHVYTDDVHERILSSYIEVEMELYEKYDGDFSFDELYRFVKTGNDNCEDLAATADAKVENKAKILSKVRSGKLSKDSLELVLQNKDELNLTKDEIQIIKEKINSSHTPSTLSGRLSDYIIW